MGFTFKGDCPDVRNTKIIDIIKELNEFNMSVDVYDSWAAKHEVQEEYGIELIDQLEPAKYDAIILAVDHREIKEMGAAAIRALGKPDHVLYDVKYVLPLGKSDLRL
ncbi:MAG: UDP binding domain-containing protein [Plesiomonas sp.]